MDLPNSPSLLLLMLRVSKVKQSEMVSKVSLKLVCDDGLNALHITVGESW